MSAEPGTPTGPPTIPPPGPPPPAPGPSGPRLPEPAREALRKSAQQARKQLRPVRKHLIVLGVAIVIALVFAGLRLLGVGVSGIPVLSRESCTVTAASESYDLTSKQAENASAIAAQAVRRGLPARAASVVLAVELADHSLGRDPAEARALYERLSSVADYRRQSVPGVAQQISDGSRDSYRDSEAQARALASALTGNTPEAFSCVVKGGSSASSGELSPAGLTSRAETVREDVRNAFGRIPDGGYQPGGVTNGHMKGSAHYEGRAVDYFFRPINQRNNIKGWALAQYFVANADRLDVQTVIYDDRIWTRFRSAAGWRDYDVPARGGDQAILEHRDHVHVDVAG
ncbi:hypothetical protein J2S40_000564 [Nocardioides luteus]|uniref:ARB-07466-like C-terminal domain-containing protein n=1 Tax=Nocardioides luteus TaxID=1844 RepID=A0ABQ5SV55_9ACTN|nr:hypothetical protein [Nocardioides luteus]MDR7309506.1 hypothetical protein [Nocardioides luteus]GGR51688.1 hypothetical protein GCM10010197_17260 [Nocardioides luteus]GLJ67910.1 hypothetical protein GCM10017579_19460 [Nocardioides luteus]